MDNPEHPPRTVVIMGAGAIGLALAADLIKTFSECKCLLTYRNNKPEISDKRISLFKLDALNEEAFPELIEHVERSFGEVDWLINTIGLLHDADNGIQPEKRLQNFNLSQFQTVMATNVVPTVLAAKYFSRLWPKSRSAVFASISARVGSISDNRLGGWHSYRASKSSLNMMLKNIALEWSYKKPNVCVLSLHPGTTDSGLSEPFQKNVPEGKLFSPERTARYLIDVISTKSPGDSGCFYDWSNKPIPW